MNSDNELAQIIRILRAKYDLSQEEFAFRCGMQPGHISKIERGEHKPNIDTIGKIATAFSMSTVEFLGLNETFLETPDCDTITAKIIGIAKNLSETERLQLLKIAKTFLK